MIFIQFEKTHLCDIVGPYDLSDSLFYFQLFTEDYIDHVFRLIYLEVLII